MKSIKTRLTQRHTLLIAAGLLVLAGALALAVGPTVAAEGSPLHPVFPLLDADGANVLDTGNPVSTVETCGACHDTEFITTHSLHADKLVAGLIAPSGETLAVNPADGEIVAFDGSALNGEMNCFLCHTTQPNNDARLAALFADNMDWVSTATLDGTGIVTAAGEGYSYNAAAFDTDGNLRADSIGIQAPKVANCAQCHGAASAEAIEPYTFDPTAISNALTLTSGQVYAAQRMNASGMNLDNKDALDRAFDVHAERALECVDCHYALNNPVFDVKDADYQPDHLDFDPRRLDPGEYLLRPVHELARTSADTVTPEDGRCASCHDAVGTHTWLPYADRHFEKMACESCHIPQMEAPALESVDWTVLDDSGSPVMAFRGLGDEGLIVGFEPALVPRDNGDGTQSYSPANLVSQWYWASGGQPVLVADLHAAYFDGDSYAPAILAAFDADGNGTLSGDELFIDSDAKEAAVAGRLAAIGVNDASIESTVTAAPISHSTTHGEFATRDCRMCHGEDSRLAAPVALTSGGPTPGGVLPTLGADGPLAGSGSIDASGSAAIVYQPDTASFGDDTYLFGHTRSKIIDWIGILTFLGTLGAVFVHGGLRTIAARRQAHNAEPEIAEVYMYGVYERLWHWLQTGVILLLIFTGLVIHKPDMFGMFSFRGIVLVHNVLAAILVINAALALFYHLASGEIRQFLPKPRGFFGQSIEQAKFYLKGIFQGDPHPFDKTPEHKLNPLQQITYFGLLNLLLPAQIITGALMWGAQRWPALANLLGGLPVLAPIHTLVAWLFGAFVVAHVYLTTTGHEPLASIRGMILGWDEVETAPASAD